MRKLPAITTPVASASTFRCVSKNERSYHGAGKAFAFVQVYDLSIFIIYSAVSRRVDTAAALEIIE